MTLARASWEVLKADKELLMLPLLSFLASLAVVGSFVVGILQAGGETFIEDTSPAMLFVITLGFYLATAFITIFFNSALVYAANERLSGGDPTVSSALGGAFRRIGSIFVWALVSATVSMILRSIQERAGWVGRLVAGIAGIAWALVTFLVLPVLVIEGARVGESIRRSGSLFKKTWGENVAAQIGFGLLGFLLILPAVLVLVLAGFAALGEMVFFLVLGVALLWIFLVSLVLTALNGIFQTALYRYAVGAEGRGYFTEADMQKAFIGRGGGAFRAPPSFPGRTGRQSTDHWEAPPGSWSAPAGDWDQPDEGPKPADPWGDGR